MKRSDARELAVHLIYGRGFTGEDPGEITRVRLAEEYYGKLAEVNEIYADRPSKKQQQYIVSVVAGVTREQDAINQQISKFSIGWDVNRISRLTRAILQLAIYEILHVEDAPTGVVISEAVRLAKKYDGDETGAFVNGILGSYARSLTVPPEENP